MSPSEARAILATVRRTSLLNDPSWQGGAFNAPSVADALLRLARQVDVLAGIVDNLLELGEEG